LFIAQLANTIFQSFFGNIWTLFEIHTTVSPMVATSRQNNYEAVDSTGFNAFEVEGKNLVYTLTRRLPLSWTTIKKTLGQFCFLFCHFA
jgi:hypothetical protein